MYCPNCGQQIADGAAFCTACGANLARSEAPVQRIPVQPVQQVQQPGGYPYQNAGDREKELGILTNAWQYFSQLTYKYQEYDHACKQVSYFARGAKSALLIWGCIAATLGLLLTILMASDYSTQEAAPLFLCLFTIPGIAMIVGGILMKVNNRKKLTSYQNRFVQLTEELYNCYAAYPGCPVGLEYTNPDTIAYIMKILQSGRAYTIKDSLNIVLSEKARNINRYTEKIMRGIRDISGQGSLPVILPGEIFKF